MAADIETLNYTNGPSTGNGEQLNFERRPSTGATLAGINFVSRANLPLMLSPQICLHLHSQHNVHVGVLCKYFEWLREKGLSNLTVSQNSNLPLV